MSRLHSLIPKSRDADQHFRKQVVKVRQLLKLWEETRVRSQPESRFPVLARRHPEHPVEKLRHRFARMRDLADVGIRIGLQFRRALRLHFVHASQRPLMVARPENAAHSSQQLVETPLPPPWR